MFKFNCFLLFLINALAAGASSSDEELSSIKDTATRLGIYRGRTTTIEKHPYLVSILLNGTFNCPGTIVSSRWVVTIIECVNVVGYNISSYSVLAGSSDTVSGQLFAVSNITLHPKYAGTQYPDYDYACVLVTGSFTWSTKVNPIKLPRRMPEPKTKMTVAGWGAKISRIDGRTYLVLREGMMRWQPRWFCKSTYSVLRFRWTSRLACAYNKGKTTLCSHDFGDPFVNRGVFYGMFLMGLHSGWCTSNAKPVLLANIHPVAPWIKHTTGAKYED